VIVLIKRLIIERVIRGQHPQPHWQLRGSDCLSSRIMRHIAVS